MISSLDGIVVGDLYTTTGKDAWRVKMFFIYQNRQIIVLTDIDTDEEYGGAVGTSSLREFRPLVPEYRMSTLFSDRIKKAKTICVECQHCNVVRSPSTCLPDLHLCRRHRGKSTVNPITGKEEGRHLQYCSQINNGNCPKFESIKSGQRVERLNYQPEHPPCSECGHFQSGSVLVTGHCMIRGCPVPSNYYCADLTPKS